MRAAAMSGLLGALALTLALTAVPKPLAGSAAGAVAQVRDASVAVYVSLRTINAAISVIREAEFGGSIGVSASVRPLGWLDPIDDTVERMAGIVFWITVVSGVLALAMEPLSALGWALLGLAFLVRGAMHLVERRAPPPDPLRRGQLGLFALGGGLAVVLPIALMAGLALGERFTAGPWEEGQATLREVAAAADAVVAPHDAVSGETLDGETDEQEGMWRLLRQRFGDTTGFVSGYVSAAGVFWDEADAIFEASFTLAGIFLLRLVILPALLFWALYLLARRLLA